VILSFNRQGKSYAANLDEPIAISIAVQREHSVGSFGIVPASYRTYTDGDFIGNTNQGGPCNLETITFTPHGNSTHTECVGHIADSPFLVNDHIADTYYLAALWSLSSLGTNDKMSLNFEKQNFIELNDVDALVIRSLPNTPDRIHTDYSGQNATYIAVSDMQKIVDSGIKHLIIDLPSVDPEWDGGALAAHHVFWQYPANTRTNASITEFAFIPNELNDGQYLLKLNIGNFESDAAPSRPVLYPIIAG
jgi:arylformamidase